MTACTPLLRPDQCKRLSLEQAVRTVQIILKRAQSHVSPLEEAVNSVHIYPGSDGYKSLPHMMSLLQHCT